MGTHHTEPLRPSSGWPGLSGPLPSLRWKGAPIMASLPPTADPLKPGGLNLRVDPFDDLPVACLQLDSGGHILALNGAALELLGGRRAALMGRLLTDCLQATHQLACEALLRQATTAQPVQPLLARLNHPGGQGRHVQIGVRAAEAGLTGATLLVTLTDVSALTLDLDEVTTLNRVLEGRAAASHDRLRELDDELDTFVQALTHDLQVPLRRATSLANRLFAGRDSDSGQSQRDLDGVTRHIGCLDQLVTELAAYFRAGRHRITLMPVDLNRVLRQVGRDHQARIEGQAVVWRQDALPTVICDPRSLQLIFGQLVDNALRYGRSGGVSEIRVLARDTVHEHLIGVQDNGPGLTPEQRKRVFMLRQRTTGGASGGLSSGLALVRRLARRHGGRVWAERGEDGGSCFWVALPRVGLDRD